MLRRIVLVLSREYISRVKKRSFIIMTFLTPLLIALFYGIAYYVVNNQLKEQTAKKICVFDESGSFTNQLRASKQVTFSYKVQPYDTSYDFSAEGFDAVLILNKPDSGIKKYSATLFTRESLSLSDQSRLEHRIAERLYNVNLNQMHVSKEQLEAAEVAVSLDVRKWSNGALEESSSGAATGIGFASSILIYFFIFIYGSQVMRGVIEEKTNRIVEVIISSVKPFELMMGKILGIAAVALTQMALWVILSSVAMGFVTQVMGSQMSMDGQMMEQAAQGGNQFNMLHTLSSLPLGMIGFSFFFYFIFGYLFYAALFAAIGSAVDSETEVQQFTLPVSMPLVFSLIITQSLIGTAPNGTLIKWLSVIPFSSPVSMMARIPFLDQSNYWQLGVSILVLIVSFIGATWVAARIYRTGILMYGKKASWKEIGKWLFYKSR